MASSSVCVPSVSHSHPPASLGDSLRTACRSAPGFYQITAFALGPSVCKILCAPFKHEVSTSPSPLGLLKLSLLAFKGKFSGVSSSQCRTTKLGSPRWGSELSLLEENLCNIIILYFVGCPSRGMGLDYIMSPPLLPVSLCFLLHVFSCRRSFLVDSGLLHQ